MSRSRTRGKHPKTYRKDMVAIGLGYLPPLENLAAHINNNTGVVTVTGNFRLPEPTTIAVITNIAKKARKAGRAKLPDERAP